MIIVYQRSQREKEYIFNYEYVMHTPLKETMSVCEKAVHCNQLAFSFAYFE